MGLSKNTFAVRMKFTSKVIHRSMFTVARRVMVIVVELPVPEKVAPAIQLAFP